MIDEEKKKRIKQLRDNGLTIKEISKALEVSESTVQRHSSDNQDENNETDKKTANGITNIMLQEGYDFEDEIMPTLYKLKNQANELDLTLFDYINDISNIMNKFLRLTDNPSRFYYIFCELSNNLSLITENINAQKFVEATENFYDREIEMDKIDDYIRNQEAKLIDIMKTAKKEYSELQEKIENSQMELDKLASTKTTLTMKLLEQPTKQKLEKAEKLIQSLKVMNKRLIKKFSTSNTENKNLKEINNLLDQKIRESRDLNRQNIFMKTIFAHISASFPTELEMIIEEVKKNEKLP